MCLPKQVSGAAIQSIATAVGNLLCFNFGLTFGITPAHMRLYESEVETPLNRSTDAEGTAWLTGYLFLSAAIGAAITGYLVQRIGPKSVLLLSGLLQITGWFCIHFGYDIVHIYASRMFAGVAAGAAFVALPIFINEITENGEKSSKLTFTIELWRTVGILCGFVLGFYVKYDYVNIVGCCASFLFSMTFPFVQETPQYYLRKQNVACLEKSLRWYRGIRDIDDREKPEYLHELAEIKAEMKDGNKSIGFAPMSNVYILRLICLSLLLEVGAKMGGVFVALNYAESFLGSGNGFNIEINYIVLSSVCCIGALLARLVGPRMPRKLLLSLSSLCAAVSVVALALFKLYGDQWMLGVWFDQYLPLILLSSQFLFVSFGLSPLSSVISSEVLPIKLHHRIDSLSSACSWLLLFVMINSFNGVKLNFGITFYLWIFAGASIFVVLISLPLLPETRNRRPSAVQRELGYAGNGNVAKSTAQNNGHITSHI